MQHMVRSDLSQFPAYVPGKALPDVLRVASNETAEAPLPAVTDAIEDAAARANRYPDMGVMQLREELAAWLSRSPGAPTLTRDNVIVSNGSSALCLQAIQSTCMGGDEVVFPWRSFEAYPILAQIAGAKPVAVPLNAEHAVDLDAMLAAVNDRTRVVFVCNPNNPTGTTVAEEQLVAFLEAVPERVAVILDEAYIEYDRSNFSGGGAGHTAGGGADHAASAAGAGEVSEVDEVNCAAGALASVNSLPLLERFPNLAICRTFSKAYSLAGLRLGYLVAQPEFITAMSKVAIPFGVNALAQVAGLASISDASQKQLNTRVEETIEERSRVLANLPEELRVPSQTNFVWLPVGDRAADLDAALQDEGVTARAFTGEGVRVTVTNHAEVDKLLPALQQALKVVGY